MGYLCTSWASDRGHRGPKIDFSKSFENCSRMVAVPKKRLKTVQCDISQSGVGPWPPHRDPRWPVRKLHRKLGVTSSLGSERTGNGVDLAPNLNRLFLTFPPPNPPGNTPVPPNRSFHHIHRKVRKGSQNQCFKSFEKYSGMVAVPKNA